jgi:hypothetical protein
MQNLAKIIKFLAFCLSSGAVFLLLGLIIFPSFMDVGSITEFTERPSSKLWVSIQ